MSSDDQNQVRALTAQVVAAYVGKNAIATADVSGLIGAVHAALQSLNTTGPTDSVPTEAPTPAVPIRKSVTPDFIACLECGEKLKMLKRHLKTDHGLAPDEYRTKWKLPTDYPMVAPNYAKLRSELAVKIGLGKRGQ